MTPREHYEEAERLLAEAADAFAVNPLGPAAKYLVAAAQVHATLSAHQGGGS
jgi:hypothetical protein